MGAGHMGKLIHEALHFVEGLYKIFYFPLDDINDTL